MAELTLQAYHREHELGAASCRYFTVYGPRGVENHAVIAMIARAFVRQDPFEVWGDGTQIRNWTYVDDIVSGTILAAEKINDGTAVNLGTMERIRVKDAAQMVLEYAGIKRRNPACGRDMPTGPVNRVADNALAKSFSVGNRRPLSAKVLRRRWIGISPQNKRKKSAAYSRKC